MNMNRLYLFGLLFALVFFILLPSSVYIVNQSEQAIVLRLGKIVQTSATKEASIKEPGLHFKLPFLIDSVRKFDVRLQTHDVDESRIVTSEKKDLLVDYYVKWRIVNLPLFFNRTNGNFILTRQLIEQKINDGLRAEFGKRTIKEVVTGERRDIMALLLQQAKESVLGLGVDVVDVRIKRIDLPSEVSSAVFERMQAERQRFATEHRAQGRSKSEQIRAKADSTVIVLRAEADKESKRIRGEGDAVAAKIYAEAYQADPEFFSFYRSVSAYKNVFSNKGDIVVLKPDSYFFKYFNNVIPKQMSLASRKETSTSSEN